MVCDGPRARPCYAAAPRGTVIVVMIYELRIYEIVPGRMAAIHERFANHTMRIFERMGIEVVGFWQEVVGRSHRIVYITRFADMGEHAAKWQAFAADPEWREVKGSTEADGPIVARVISSFMTPTAYSPMQ